MRKMITRVIALTLAVLSLCAMLTVSASAASWVTGNVPTNHRDTSGTYVYLNNTNKDGKIKLHAYSETVTGKSKEANCRLHVILWDGYTGAWLWESDVDTGSHGVTLKLGRNHSCYKISLREAYVKNGIEYYRMVNPLNFPKYFGIECTSNTWTY